MLPSDSAAAQAIILKFYDALINTTSWHEALDEFAWACGADSASIAIGESLYPMYENRIIGKKINDVFENREGYNTRFGDAEISAYEVVYQKPVQTWVTDEEAYGKPVEEIECAHFQRENFGVFRRAAVRLNDTPIWADGLVLHFNENRGNITPEEAEVSRIFLPHIAKAIELSRPFRLLRERFSGVLGVLDMLRIGVVITSSSGAVVVTNRRADEVLSSDNGVTKDAGGGIKLLREDDDLRFQQCLATAAASSTHNTYSAVMTTPRRDRGSHWILETFRLSDSSGSIDGDFQGACTFIIDPHQQDLVSPAAMQEVFRLTGAEADICRMLSEGIRIEEIAERRRVSPGTVRTQIKSLFDKTSSRSQVDLVRQALRVNLPVKRPNEIA